jgi:phosphohistidine phosphatase
MDRLILLRHAKAESDAPSGDDFDRPLAPRGRREAKAMGERLAAMGARPDVVLVSTARRTHETWEILEDSLPGAEVRLLPGLYNAEAATLRQLVETAGEKAGVVMVVAHNPGLQELTVRLLSEGESPAAYLARAQRAFPPAAVAIFDFDVAGRPVVNGLFYPERDA